MDTAITLMSPYIMYLVAEQFHFSGVLSVVSGGLFLSANAFRMFSYETRLQTTSVWDTLVFLLNGIVFILIGLQLPAVTQNLNGYTLTEAIIYGLIISLVVVILRILFVYSGVYFPRLLSKKKEKEKNRYILKLHLQWPGAVCVV